jgi:hypothetical protein
MEDADLDAAVSAGLLDPATRDRLLAFLRERRRPAVNPDDENFRLVTGFNDIFVSIACCLVFVAIGVLGYQMAIPSTGASPSPFGLALVALVTAFVAWAMAEYFTRRQRMALPSILLLLIFVAACGAVGGFLAAAFQTGPGPSYGISGVTAVAGAVVHWRRFHVPITVAAGTAAACGGLVALMGVIVRAPTAIVPLVGALGLVVFAEAMWFDISDRNRTTRRSDVAFWLHLLAAPMIVHPLLSPSGLLGNGETTAFGGGITLVVFAILIVTALVIDRRALVVSALAYVIVALNTVLGSGNTTTVTFGLTALVIGLFLVLLSAAWRSVRAVIIDRLPASVRQRVPPVIVH